MGSVTSIVPALNKGLQRQHLPHRELISAQCSITGERFAPNERESAIKNKRSWARTLALKAHVAIGLECSRTSGRIIL
jgi:hypothetical protein